MNSEIQQAMQARAVEGQLACEHAHAIAAQFGVSPSQVVAIANDELNLRFYRCQLGLFGYGPKSLGQSKIVLPAAHVPPKIEAALRQRAHENHIACADVWEVAEQFAYPRLGMANIVEALGLQVRPCQLGCF